MALTPQPPGNPSPPNDLTEQAVADPAIPNNLTEQTAGSPAIPNNLTEQAAGSPAIPNDLTEAAVGAVAIPNNLTEQAAGSPAIPNNLTEQAVANPAAPNDLASDPVTNLVLQSGNIRDGAWTKNDSTIISSGSDLVSEFLAPDVLQRIEPASTATIAPIVAQSVTVVSGQEYTLSFFARASQLRYIQVSFGSADVSGDPRVNFDLANDSQSIDAIDGGITATIGNSIEVVSGAQLARITVTFTPIVTSLLFRVQLLISNTATRLATEAHTTGDGLYLSGFQLQTGGQATSYIRTTTAQVTQGELNIPNNLTEQAAGSPAIPNNLTEQAVGSVAIPNNLNEQAVGEFPRTFRPLLDLNFAEQVYGKNDVPKEFDDLFTYTRNSIGGFWNRRKNPQGRWQTFIDTDWIGSITNLVTYSTELTTTGTDWLLSTGCLISKSFTDKTPDGFDAFILGSDGNQPFPNLNQTLTETGQNNWSFYCKDIDSGYLVIRLEGTDVGAAAQTVCSWQFNFDGTFTYQSGYTTPELGASYEGDGWWRIYLAVDTTTLTKVNIYPKWNESVEGSVLVGQAQLTAGAKIKPFIETIATTVSETFTEAPRFEYDPVTAESRGYLAESGSTNLQEWSQELERSTFNKSGLNSTTPVLANAILAPDGTYSADKIRENSVNEQHYIQDSITFTASDYTFSVYAKAGERSQIVLRSGSSGVYPVNCRFDLSSGIVVVESEGSASIEDVGDGWYRCSVTALATAAATNCRVTLHDGSSSTYTGVSGNGVYLWGWQVEEEEYATSYIYTDGGTTLRAPDVALTKLPIGLDMSREFTARVIFRKNYVQAVGNRFALWQDDASTNGLFIGARDGNEQVRYRVGSLAASPTGNLKTLDNSEVVLRLAADGLATGFIDKVNGGTSTPTLNNVGERPFYVGSNDSNTQQLDGTIKRITIYQLGLTDTEIDLI